jgi:hypothetical protein
VEHWRWNILARPGVERDGIRVLVTGDRAVGYAVATRSGCVLEFAVSDELRPSDRQRGATALLVALEAYARGKGLETLELDVPPDDRPVYRALRRRGYHAEVGDSLQLVIVDLLAFLEALLERRGADAGMAGRTFLLVLEPGAYRFCPFRHVLISLGTPPRVAAVTSESTADCTICLDMSTLAETVLRRAELDLAFAERRIVVTPEGSRGEAAKLLRALGLRDPWYVPSADGR